MGERLGDWEVDAAGEKQGDLNLHIRHLSLSKDNNPHIIMMKHYRDVYDIIFSTREIQDNIKSDDSLTTARDDISRNTWSQKGLGNGYWRVEYKLLADCTMNVKISNADGLPMEIEGSGIIWTVTPDFDDEESEGAFGGVRSREKTRNRSEADDFEPKTYNWTIGLTDYEFEKDMEGLEELIGDRLGDRWAGVESEPETLHRFEIVYDRVALDEGSEALDEPEPIFIFTAEIDMDSEGVIEVRLASNLEGDDQALFSDISEAIEFIVSYAAACYELKA